ncbi:hypothetical protein GO283_04916 [Ralstonia solanacearum]|nr:hypothetical protein [Ralstonia solanacearum]
MDADQHRLRILALAGDLQRGFQARLCRRVSLVQPRHQVRSRCKSRLRGTDQVRHTKQAFEPRRPENFSLVLFRKRSQAQAISGQAPGVLRHLPVILIERGTDRWQEQAGLLQALAKQHGQIAAVLAAPDQERVSGMRMRGQRQMAIRGLCEILQHAAGKQPERGIARQDAQAFRLRGLQRRMRSGRSANQPGVFLPCGQPTLPERRHDILPMQNIEPSLRAGKRSAGPLLQVNQARTKRRVTHGLSHVSPSFLRTEPQCGCMSGPMARGRLHLPSAV